MPEDTRFGRIMFYIFIHILQGTSSGRPRAPGALSGCAMHEALGTEVDRGHSQGKTNKYADVIYSKTGAQGVQ